LRRTRLLVSHAVVEMSYKLGAHKPGAQEKDSPIGSMGSRVPPSLVARSVEMVSRLCGRFLVPVMVALFDQLRLTSAHDSQPLIEWSYWRLAAYSFFRVAEGA